MFVTIEQFDQLQDDHTLWLKLYHTRPPRDTSRPRPVVPTGSVNRLLLSQHEINLVYQWMIDEIEWFKYQFK